jgi:hypothetical protein
VYKEQRSSSPKHYACNPYYPHVQRTEGRRNIGEGSNEVLSTHTGNRVFFFLEVTTGLDITHTYKEQRLNFIF